VYRYGFNGKEHEDDINSGGGDYDFGARIYDSRIARWLAVDPRGGLMPNLSSYAYAFNSPISLIDLDGLIPWPVAGTSVVNKKDLASNGIAPANTVVRTSTYLETERPKGATNPHIGISALVGHYTLRRGSAFSANHQNAV
jgi:RHS repeat-associated protein